MGNRHKAHCARGLFVLFALFGTGATGCGGSHGAPPVGTATGSSMLVVSAETSRSSGIPGTRFDLHATNLTPDREVASWTWDLGAAGTATGADASAVFTDPGIYSVEVTAVDAGGATASSGVVLTVFDPAGTPPAPAGVILPALLGDADDDGDVDLADAHKILKHANLLTRLTDPAGLLAADFDSDGVITSEDARLVSLTVAGGAQVPELLLPASGGPGVGVRLFSQHLLDPAADIQIQVGASAPLSPWRPILGQANFLIPLDAAGDPRQGITPGPIDVTLISNGTDVATFTFQLEALPPLPGDPQTVLMETMEAIAPELQAARAALESYLSSVGATQDEGAPLLALLDLAAGDLASVAADIEAALQGLSPESRELFFIALRSNGLAEAHATVQAKFGKLGTGGRTLAGDSLIDSLCTIQDVLDVLDKVDTFLGYACTAVNVGALIPGPQQPVLVALAGVCGTISIASDVYAVVSDLVPTAGDDLIVKASPTSLQPGETAEVTVEISVNVWNQICLAGTGKLESMLKDKLAERIAKKTPVVGAVFQLLKLYPLEERGAVRAMFLEKLREIISDVIGHLFDLTGLDDLLESLREKVCSLFDPLNPYVKLEPNGVLGSVSPADAATLTLPAAGSGQPALLMCLDPQGGGSGSVSIMVPATRVVCGKTLQGSATVICGTVSGVTFTIGDNGSLLDDIFELQVDGMSVLSSNVPVTSITETVQLTSGTHNLALIGHAAPDGVGTYFLTVVGATVVSGPPLSGSDLTAGTTFHYVIEVP